MIFLILKKQGRGGALCKAAPRVQGTPWQKAEGVPHKFALRIANLWGPRRGQKERGFDGFAFHS
ncbi:hypothetical protein CEN44_13190 [Fischerella muscicola CCMEE 5323]|uniref:Uncharacterized protein n=1 Tax=Fischerella muscicola CCMEE 5323 TaxID=2019572 RepID=A0A2N6K2Q5_FISMU|nr:hypothetical protein CEN44_13190 [Fischerella muscicola CCMEE 5323]